MKPTTLKAPYPYFGGKSRVAPAVWARFGEVRNYVEPFFGSGAMLLGRPTPFNGPETVNDLDGFVANFWRALQADPEAVATAADNPVNENDLHARHAWLVGRKDSMQARLEGDPDWFDAKIAGWWVWGLCCWIGRDWCSGKGPWRVVESEDGPILANAKGDAGRGVNRQRPHLGDAGRGVNRQLPHLGDAGQGVNRQLPHLGDAGRGVTRSTLDLQSYLVSLADRMRGVRVCSGDWRRVCGPSVTTKHAGVTGVFLDPPYGECGRDANLYRVESLTVADAVREWCLERGDDPKMRIALAGYEGEHEALESAGWSAMAWKTSGGMGNTGKGEGRANAARERIWFSPHCVAADANDTLPLAG
jgi:hypothetical protein